MEQFTERLVLILIFNHIYLDFGSGMTMIYVNILLSYNFLNYAIVYGSFWIPTNFRKEKKNEFFMFSFTMENIKKENQNSLKFYIF